MSKRYDKALREAQRTGNVSGFVRVAEEENLKRYKDPFVRETARRLRTDELEVRKIEEKTKEKDADWLGRWLQKFSIEGDFWLKEKREKIKKSDWLQGTIGISFTGEMMDDIVEWVGNVFSDISPLLLLIVGVGLGLIVIGAIISALRR